MDYEKAYKEAFERAKEIHNEHKAQCFDVMLKVFPELKENQTEKIREEIVDYLKKFIPHHDYDLVTKSKQWIAWLEKQGKKSNIHQDAEDDLRRQSTIRILEYARSLDAYNQYGKESINKDIAWLEKQGEQKSVSGNDRETEINLAEILKHYPRETELYSPLYGKLWLAEVDERNGVITCYKYPLDKGATRAILEQEDTVSFYSNGTTGLPDFNISEDCMLFLYNTKKQSERRLFDNVEPKFKVGDWVVHNRNDHSREIMQIYDIRDGRYYFNDNVHFSWSIKECDEKSRLWTIQDARDGDVLVLNNEVFIYAHRKQMYSIAVAHCFVDSAGSFYLDGEFGYKEFGKTISPATKEQRDLLSQKMKEAGYEWDSEKKELNKIEQKHACGEDDKDALDEDYISFETAKLLNEKGFKQECDYATSWYAKQYYKNSCQGEWFEGKHQIIEDIEDKCNISYLSSMNIFIPAPTLQMAMKWLREIYDLHVVTRKDFFNGTYTGRIYDGRRENVFDKEDYIGFVGCETYEKACEAAIKYCLENLI